MIEGITGLTNWFPTTIWKIFAEIYSQFSKFRKIWKVITIVWRTSGKKNELKSEYEKREIS